MRIRKPAALTPLKTTGCKIERKRPPTANREKKKDTEVSRHKTSQGQATCIRDQKTRPRWPSVSMSKTLMIKFV